MSSVIFAKLDYTALLKSPRKGIRRQMQIAEAAIEILYRHGLLEFSYDRVAKRCGIARAGIYSYFPTLTDLLLFACGLIRFHFQKMVLDKVANCSTPFDRLSAYAEASLSWVDVAPKHASVWLLFYHQCNVSREIAEHHRQWVDMAAKRIEAMLLEGVRQGEFMLKNEECLATARLMQHLMTGALVSRATEGRDFAAWAVERNEVLKQILVLAKVRRDLKLQ